MNSDMSTLFGYSGIGGRGNLQSPLPDPYVLYSTYHMPTNMINVLRLCEHLWLSSGQYKMAMERVSRYFITKVVFDDVNDKEKKRYEEFFNDHLNINTLLSEVADDFMCYGNSFSSLYMPFNRILICKKCNYTQNIEHVKDENLGFKPDKLMFEAFCPRCNKRTLQEHKDLRSMDENRIHLIRWNPHEIQLLHQFLSGETQYLWNISPDIKTNIKGCKPIWLRSSPWEVIKSVATDSFFKFNKDVIYHMRESVIAGVRNRGWGIPRLLAAYKDMYYVQILKRFNEALALDYIVPFRVITPAKATSADPLMQYDMSAWNSKMQDMVVQHRRDPADYHMLPFPINYQVLGGEGQSLSPWQLIKQGTSDMMDSLGVPMELFQGTLSLQAAPTALRLFEASWPHLVSSLNGWLNWIVQRISMTFGWQPATAKLQRVTWADDIERRNLIFNLNAAQKMSDGTAFALIGSDAMDEQKRMMEENRNRQALQREFEEAEMKRQELQDTLTQFSQPPQQQMMGQAGGAMPAQPGQAAPPQPVGGMPGMTMPGNPSSGPVTPQDLLTQAQDTAQQLWGMDPTSRRRELLNLKSTNPVLWAQVKGMLQELTTQAASSGVQQSRAAAMQGG